MKIAILVFMLMGHLLDDYVLQGWLAKAKQKSWWKENAPGNLYKHDWAMALLCHCLSWSISMMLPIVIWSISTGNRLGFLWFALPANLSVHFVVDDLKANKMKINLIIDQSIHFVQILATWGIWLAMFWEKLP